jgi:hypothetical protein
MVMSYHHISLNHLIDNLIYLSLSSSFCVTLPLPPRHHQAPADFLLLRCRHHRSCRAAATALPLSHCALPPRCYRRCATAKLLPPSHCCAAATATTQPLHHGQAAANGALLRCCHCHHRRVAATALPLTRCALLPSCRRRRSVVLLPPLLLPPPHRRSLVGCCAVVRCPISSSHAVMQPSMLLLPAAFTNNCLPSPPPPPPPLPPGRNHRHCHHRGQTHRCTLTKKEAVAALPPVYQLLHHCENNYKSRQLGKKFLIPGSKLRSNVQ